MTNIEGDEDQTVLVLLKTDGEDSFIETHWRNAENKMQTSRMDCTLARRTVKEIFFGYVHSSYLTVAGLRLGAPTEAEIDAIHNWSAQSTPPHDRPAV